TPAPSPTAQPSQPSRHPLVKDPHSATPTPAAPNGWMLSSPSDTRPTAPGFITRAEQRTIAGTRGTAADAARRGRGSPAPSLVPLPIHPPGYAMPGVAATVGRSWLGSSRPKGGSAAPKRAANHHFFGF